MDGYKIFFVVPITVIVTVLVFIGVPSITLLVFSPDYDVNVDARIDKQNSPIIGQVLIQNTGSQPLTNIIVDFGEGDILDIGTLDNLHKVILTPPADNKMEFVTVSTDQTVIVKKMYREVKITE
ncbi:hypothetical protein [Nitrosopumilus adriaticus]|uniref:hypothetical protein n=1 Tax=Nitrosopumilus adriaticus TaxID=1580092 RepID=UPI00352EBB23